MVQALVSGYKLVLIIDKYWKLGERTMLGEHLLLSFLSIQCIWSMRLKTVLFCKNACELFVNVNVYLLLSTAPVLCRHPVPTTSPQLSCSDTSPTSSACSDNASSTSDCDSEHDQVSPLSEEPARIKKKRQRTTFSPLEVWELERAYMRQPYLLTKDEEDLVHRLGITAKSLKVKIFFLLQNKVQLLYLKRKIIALVVRHIEINASSSESTV